MPAACGGMCNVAIVIPFLGCLCVKFGITCDIFFFFISCGHFPCKFTYVAHPYFHFPYYEEGISGGWELPPMGFQ